MYIPFDQCGQQCKGGTDLFLNWLTPQEVELWNHMYVCCMTAEERLFIATDI